MGRWFTIDEIDDKTHVISEYRHWEETHCYLIEGRERSLLIDTGLGIDDISSVVTELTRHPVTAVATHLHWDHIGGHRYFSEFYAHEAELNWLMGAFPLPERVIKEMITRGSALPDGYNVNAYTVFQGTPSRLLRDGESIDLGERTVVALHTPGHSPGHLCFWEPDRGFLYIGDLVYKGPLYAHYPSTDPSAYLSSLERISRLQTRRVLPAHHSLDIHPEIILRIRDALREMDLHGDLHHGSGCFEFTDWSIRF